MLLLKEDPPPFWKNQALARLNVEFVQWSIYIADLLGSGCCRVVPHLPYICSPLSVVESSMAKKS